MGRADLVRYKCEIWCRILYYALLCNKNPSAEHEIPCLSHELSKENRRNRRGTRKHPEQFSEVQEPGEGEVVLQRQPQPSDVDVIGYVAHTDLVVGDVDFLNHFEYVVLETLRKLSQEILEVILRVNEESPQTQKCHTLALDHRPRARR